MATPKKARKLVPHNGFEASQLQTIFIYNKKTGQLRWKKRSDISSKWSQRWNARYAGKTAGSVHGNGYMQTSIFKEKFLTHVIIWALVTKTWPDIEIDHRNTKKSDNRWCNLRKATPQQNSQNVKLLSANTSGLKGVSWHAQSKKWLAQIRAAGIRTYLGLYKTKKQAHAAYKKAAIRLHKEFANFG